MNAGPDPLTRLEHAIEKLRIEYEKFFNGAEAIPPDALRMQVESLLKQLRNHRLESVGQFRLNSLEARFNTYREMQQRRVRQREEGRGPQVRPSSFVRTTERAEPDPEQGIRLSGSLDRQGVEALYRGLYRESARVDLDSFRSYLVKNLETIQQRTGCREAEFRLVSEDGKQKLKVRPITASRDAGKE